MYTNILYKGTYDTAYAALEYLCVKLLKQFPDKIASKYKI